MSAATGQAPPAPARPATAFLPAWTRSVTAGEFLGFCGPALVGALVWDRGAAVAVPALMAAGAVEGTVLGWSQTRVLRRRLPALSVRRWVGGTAAAAGAAWGIGLLPSAAHDALAGWPPALLLPAGAVAGGALLVSIGLAQWFELRRHVLRAGSWVPASAAAWCVGLLAFFGVTTPLWRPGQGPLLVAAIGALGGLLMAATMALSTGVAMGRLLRPTGTPPVR